MTDTPTPESPAAELLRLREKATPGEWFAGTHQVVTEQGKHVLWAAKAGDRDFIIAARNHAEAIHRETADLRASLARAESERDAKHAIATSLHKIIVDLCCVAFRDGGQKFTEIGDMLRAVDMATQAILVAYHANDTLRAEHEKVKAERDYAQSVVREVLRAKDVIEVERDALKAELAGRKP